MKKPLSLLLASLLFATVSLASPADSVSAETNDLTIWGVGFQGGASASWSSTSVYAAEGATRPGYQFNAYARVFFPIYFETQLGWYQTFGDFAISGQRDKLVVNSLQWSLLGGYYFLDLDQVNFRLYSGMTFNFVMGAKWKNGVAGTPDISKDDFNPMNVAWKIGAGANVGRFSIDLFVDVGMSKVYKATPSLPNNTRNNAVGFNFGFFFLK